MGKLIEQGVKAMHSSYKFSDKEIELLRKLADRVAFHSSRPDMKEKAKIWQKHNDLETDEPVIFIDPENGWDEIITGKDLLCGDPLARMWEKSLRKLIFWAENLKDDKVIEPYFDVPYCYSDTGWGVNISKIGDERGHAYAIKAALEDYEEDFGKIHHPEIVIDWEESARLLKLGEDIFGDILIVRRKQDWWWTLGMSWDYINLRGLEDFLCDFILEPEWVDKTFDLLCRGKIAMIDFLEKNRLLSQNIEGSYVGSGGFGYTNQIQKKAFQDIITPKDMWGFCESQETVSINPDQYGEHIFPYHKKIMEKFALNCYGCCEPYEAKWKYIKQLPNLRRVSVSPWADPATVPELLGKNYIASIKPSPTYLAYSNMNEENLRKDCRRLIEQSKGGICEFIMKDNNTLGNNPKNAVRWVEIMREELARVYG